MSERYTREELDRIGRAAYVARHQVDASGPWEVLTSDRRWFWVQAGLAAIRESNRINERRFVEERLRSRGARTVRWRTSEQEATA